MVLHVFILASKVTFMILGHPNKNKLQWDLGDIFSCMFVDYNSCIRMVHFGPIYILLIWIKQFHLRMMKLINWKYHAVSSLHLRFCFWILHFILSDLLPTDSTWGRFFSYAELGRMVDQDLSRLNPEHSGYFHTPTCQAMLRRILLLWCLQHPEHGYRQGQYMNFNFKANLSSISLCTLW